MKAMWKRFCRSADGLTLPLIALAAAVLGWGAVAEYHAQLEVHQRDAKHVSQLVARESDLVLSEQHRTLAVFAEGNQALLAALAETPNDSTLLDKVNRSLARHFEPYIAFTMADAHGNEIIDDFDGNVGDLCRDGLKHFAAGDHKIASVIHPGPRHYHFDLRLGWQHAAKSNVLFVSFGPEKLAQLLAREQLHGHRLLIVQASRPDLIEITATGSRDRLGGNHTLSATDLARLARHGGFAEVKQGENWRVVDIPDVTILLAMKSSMALKVGAISGAFTLVLFMSIRMRGQRRAANDALQTAHAALEQKVVERTRRLAESELRANQIIESAPEAMLVVNADGVILRANARAETLFGYVRAELVGLMVDRLIPNDAQARHLRHRQNFMARPEPRGMATAQETRGQRKDGSTFDAAVGLAPLTLEGESQVIVSVEDISQSKAMQAELLSHRDNLEDLVAERTSELVAAHAKAHRLAQAKGEFLANMSHEIRTPLNAVLGFARIGVRENAGRKTGETCQHVLDAGVHLLGIINDILDYSKIESGKFSIESQPFQLALVINHACDFVHEAARKKGLSFQQENCPELASWVRGDAMRIQQILINLLSNAVKFTQQGEVRLRVARDAENVIFRVIDTGIGMTPEQISRLFKPFEQADSSTTRRFGGTGLGLSISQNLARLMGGEIALDSAPDQGSSFTLRLPLPPAEPEAPHLCNAPTTAQRLAGLRVLAADDVEVNRLILQDLLEYEGAQVTFAEDGQDALAQVTKQRQNADQKGFDVILMDMQMPVMDGYEATQRILELHPGQAIIGLTAHAMQEERARCLALGMVEHITKPIDPDTLVAAILRHWQADAPPGVYPDEPPISVMDTALAEIALDTSPQLPVNDPARMVTLISVVDWPKLLKRYGGRRPFVEKLIRALLASNSDTPARLRTAAQEMNFETIDFLSHNLKGMVGNLLAFDLQDLANDTNNAARAGDPKAFDLTMDLATLLESLMTALQQGPEQDNSPATG